MHTTFEQIRESIRAQKDAAYLECKEASAPCLIVKGDSKELRKQKKARRAEIWAGYDLRINHLAQLEAYQSNQLSGERFFAEVESDEDAIGWNWRRSSSQDECEQCESLVGNYRKGVRKPFPAHIGCKCTLGKVFYECDFKE